MTTGRSCAVKAAIMKRFFAALWHLWNWKWHIFEKQLNYTDTWPFMEKRDLSAQKLKIELFIQQNEKCFKNILAQWIKINVKPTLSWTYLKELCAGRKDGVCSLMLHKKQCKSARSSFWENGKAGIYIKSKGTKRQNIITHEPWAWDKSVVGRAHELKRTDPSRSATSTSLAFYNSHSFLRPLTNEHTPSFLPAHSSF